MKSCALHSENVSLAYMYMNIKVPDQPFALYSLAPRLLIFFILNSAEHEICPTNKSQITKNCEFFFLLNVAEYENFSANGYENAN